MYFTTEVVHAELLQEFNQNTSVTEEQKENEQITESNQETHVVNEQNDILDNQAISHEVNHQENITNTIDGSSVNDLESVSIGSSQDNVSVLTLQESTSMINTISQIIDYSVIGDVERGK